MTIWIELSLEDDGRWIAEALTFNGAFVYGATLTEAVTKAKELAIALLAEDGRYNET